MSLRARLLLSIVVALLLSFAAGAGMSTWHAARSVRAELSAALANAQGSARAAIGPVQGRKIETSELLRIVQAFDGSRHIRAELLDAAGTIRTTSRLAIRRSPPHWFLAVTSPALAPVIIPISGSLHAHSLRVAADPTNESYERWSDARGEVLLLGLFSLLVALLCSITLTRGLRPLTAVSDGLVRLGTGAPHVRLAEIGPPEIAAQAAAFNHLGRALQIANETNRRLQNQLASLAEEERTEIARDLHDEVGPLLFAIATFTATIDRLVMEGNMGAIPPQLRAIRDATSAVQANVRDMLGRLHDGVARPLPLADALGELAAFWARVRPQTTCTLQVDVHEAAITDAARETLFRVAQEAVSNAMRHGQPGHVTVHAASDAGHVILSVTDDGKGGPEGPGFGVAGMRARMASIGGTLDVLHRRGWIVTAQLPVSVSLLPEATVS